VTPATRGLIVAAVFAAVMAAIVMVQLRAKKRHRAALASLDGSDYATFEAKPYQLDHLKGVFEGFGWQLDRAAPTDDGTLLYTFRKAGPHASLYSQLWEGLMKTDPPQNASADVIKLKAAGSSKDENAQTH